VGGEGRASVHDTTYDPLVEEPLSGGAHNSLRVPRPDPPLLPSIIFPLGLTVLLGIAELACGLGVAFGVLTQLAAIGLILIMLGAIHRKIFVWHTGFWGEKASGWHYDLIFVVMSLVILFTYGGRWVLWK